MHRGLAKVILIGLPVLGLLGLVVTGMLRWREAANRTRCQDNLRRVGWFALWDYTDRQFAFPAGLNVNDRVNVLPDERQPDPSRAFPPGTLPHPTLPAEKRLSWSVILLPHLGKDDIYRQFNLAEAWDAETNQTPVRMILPMLACPSVSERPPPGTAMITPYIGMAGLGRDAGRLLATDPRAGFFRHDEATKTGMVQRGFSHTLTILETTRERGPWAAGGPPTCRGLDTTQTPYIGPGQQFGAHPAGCNAAFADGSVRFQSNGISPRVLQMLVPLTDREVP